MADLTIHIFSALTLLFVLILGFVTTFKTAKWLLPAIVFYGLTLFWNHPGTLVLHGSIELMSIAVLALAFKLTESRFFQLLLVPAVFYLFVSTHNFFFPHSPSFIQKLDEDGELLIEFDSPESLAAFIKAGEKAFKEVSKAFDPAAAEITELDNYALVDIYKSNDAEKIAQEIMGSVNGVIGVDYNQVIPLEPGISTEPIHSTKKTGLSDPLADQQWIFDNLDILKLHASVPHPFKGQNETLIAILDSGVEAQHEDLKSNFASIDKTSDGDQQGHGTHCAGIAGAVSNNGIGIASLLPGHSKVRITSVRVLKFMGMGTQKMVIDGMIKAVDSGAKILSISLGARTSEAKEKAYTEAVEYATEKGAIVIIAAGNSNEDAIQTSPANTTGVIAVGSVNANNDKSFFSNTVEQLAMGIYAPGENIMSTYINNSYKSFSGTSMAAPFISGLVGLMAAYKPDLDSQTAYDILRTTATQKDGMLIVNPQAALDQLFKEYLPAGI